jgi:hypothetical protein
VGGSDSGAELKAGISGHYGWVLGTQLVQTKIIDKRLSGW